MRTARTGAIIVAAAAALWLAAGCARHGEKGRTAAECRRLVQEAARLYREVQPLRSSRLGFADADSLLFTFSAEETGAATDRLRRLESGLAALPASGLDARERDEARVILHWARGELFALERIRAREASPLLFVWLAEEAIEQAPSRLDPPRPGEAESYARRLGRVPPLLANAALSLRNPAEAHTREALSRVDALLLRFDGAAALARGRYGDGVAAPLASAKAALADFRSYLETDLLPLSRGSLLLGYENLSRMFLYGEFLDADPNAVIAEAERRIARYAADRTSMERRIEQERSRGAIDPRLPLLGGRAPTTAPRDAGRPVGERTTALSEDGLAALASSFLDTLWSGESLAKTFGAPRGRRPVISRGVPTRRFAPLGVDAYLSTPPGGDPPVVVAVARDSSDECLARVLLAPAAALLGEERLRVRMLDAAPAALESPMRICEARDTIALLFESETFREGYRYFAIRPAVEWLRREDPSTYARVLDGWILDLARVIVVIRLHSGTLTAEAASRYLVETAGIPASEADREVLAATASPSLALAGIAMMTVDRMIERLSQPSGAAKPQEELRKLFRQSRGLPLRLIEEKIRRD